MNHLAARRAASFMGSLFALACVAAHAQEPRLRTFEIAPFAGMRLGGSLELADTGEDVDIDDHGSFALALDLRADEVSQYELFYSRQATKLEAGSTLGELDVDVEYFHVGGTLVLNDERWWKPYVVGTLGATRFSPEPAEANDETRFSVSLGGGVRFPFNDRFSLRLEARGYVTFVDTNTATFCKSDEEGGLCRIRGSGSTFIQYEVLAGAAFAFF